MKNPWLAKGDEAKMIISWMALMFAITISLGQSMWLPRNWPEAKRMEGNVYSLTATFSDMKHIARAKGVDVLAWGVRLSRALDENCAKGVAVEIEPKGICQTPPKLLTDGLYVYTLVCQGDLKSLVIRLRLVTHKRVCKLGIQMPSQTKIRRAKILLEDPFEGVRREFTVEFQNTRERQFVVFEPTMSTLFELRPLDFYRGYPPDRLEIAELELYEAAEPQEEGRFETEDILVPHLARWLKFEPDCQGKVEWFYSVSSGESWSPVPEGGDLSRALVEEIRPHRIRFKAVLKRGEGETLIRGFRLTFEVAPEKPLAKPIGPGERLRLEKGMFVDRDGKPVGLFGTSFDIHSNLWNWWATDWSRVFEAWGRRNVELVALYGMNVVRLAFAAPFFMPKPGVGPEHPEFERAFAEFERMAREEWKKEPSLKYGRCGEEYLKFMDRIIEHCRQNGIYVVLDWHQWPDGKRWAWGWWPDVDLDQILDGLVDVWRRLAKRYKDEPAVLGFDIPFNEPTQKWAMDDERYRRLVERIVKVIKGEAPDKLIFMEPQDWGHHCDVSEVHPISLWDFPEGVDAVYPHYYLGIHLPNTDRIEAYKGWLANWLSWFMKPAVIGEWDPSHAYLRGCGQRKWEAGLDPEFPEGMSRCIDAHLAYFYAQGVQMLNQWAWYGDPWARKGADTVLKFIHFWREHPPIPFERAKVKVGLICNSRYRANYGQSRDLQLLVDELLDCHICPFKTVFEKCVLQRPGVLKQFDALIVYTKGMSTKSLDIIERSKVPAMFVKEVRKGRTAGIARFLKRCGIEVDERTPKNILIAYGVKGFLVYERYGEGGKFRVHPRIPARGRIVVRNYATKEVVAKGTAEEIWRQGFTVRLERNRAKLFEWESERR